MKMYGKINKYWKDDSVASKPAAAGKEYAFRPRLWHENGA